MHYQSIGHRVRLRHGSTFASVVIQKVFEGDPLKYNKGSGTLRIIALINDTAMPSVDASWSTKINLSSAFAGQTIGIREVDDQIWQVSFLEYDLGYFDKERDRVEPGPSPFAPDKVLTMCPV